MIPVQHVFFLSFILFGIGIAGLMTRRDAITVFLSIELLLNAAIVAFVGASLQHGNELGHVAAFLVIAVAAAEAAIGLSIVIRLSKKSESLQLQDLKDLKG